jgi:hypothetical protein
MAITPRTPDEIRQNLIAYLVSTGVLTSIDQGDVVGTIFGGIAEELSALENKLLEFVNGHLLNVSGDLLDERVAQIPNVAPRRERVPAMGGSVTLYKDLTTGPLDFPPGTIEIANPNYPDVTYTNKDRVVLSGTSTEVRNVYFMSMVAGTRSNAPRQSVVEVVSGPGLIGCTNTEPFSGGLDREVDTFFRQRAMAMIMSLARSQASAMEALALNFTDSTGFSISHAKAVEYSGVKRGYTELVVATNGPGMPGATRTAVTTQGTVPALQAGTRHTFWFESPAATTPVLAVAGQLYAVHPNWFIPIDEKGVGWTQGVLPATVVPGAAWSIRGHLVYQGWIKEFQDVINRTCAAAGTRVRVVAADPQYVRISANCVVRNGSSLTAVMGTVKAMIVEFFNRLPPGEPALIHKLHDWVAQIDGLQNIIFYDVGGGLQEDLYPGSQRRKLSTDLTRITLN